MRKIKETDNEHNWPRKKVNNLECRERDLVVRIANWLDDSDEPAYDVEVYIGGVYDWNESKSFTLYEYKNATTALGLAVVYAQYQIAKLLQRK